MSSPKKFLRLAAQVARLKVDSRCFYLGAVAIRGDDVMVSAYNGAPKFPCPRHHCEARIARKLDRGATVYLARVSADGHWANSKPCIHCESMLEQAYVKRIYYTTAPNEWECLIF